METAFLDIPGRPESWDPAVFALDPYLMPQSLPPVDGTYEEIVGRPETFAPGAFETDPNRPGPVLTSLVPATAVLGSPNFTLHVMGENFGPDAVIVFAGHDEPTTFISWNELSTGVDMSVWLGPDPAIPVAVRSELGLLSNALTFAFTAAAGGTQQAPPPHC